MSIVRKDLSKYIAECLTRGFSFKKIEDALVKRGYPRRIAEGAILSYRHRRKTIKFFTVSILAVMFMLSLFLSGSGIAGMATLGYARRYSDEIGLIANSSSLYTWYPLNKGELMSVSVTGNLFGDGEGRILFEGGGKKYIVFDSREKSFSMVEITSQLLGGRRIKHFSYFCDESCAFRGFNKSVYTLEIELNGSVIELDKVHYEIRSGKEVEPAPEFLKIPGQQMNQGERMRINLSSFFNTTQENVTFSYVAEEGMLDAALDEGIAEINALAKGKTYLYFIAYADDMQFISNLVEINVSGRKGGESRAGMITGSFIRLPEGIDKEDDDIIRKTVSYIIMTFILLTTVILVFTPAHYYDLNYLASRLDRMRNSDSISDSLAEYNEIKSFLKENDLDEEEKSAILDGMESKVKSIMVNVPKLDIMQEFNAKYMELEDALGSKREEAADRYSELREIYLKAIESRMRDKDKRELYEKMDGYYKDLKKMQRKMQKESRQDEGEDYDQGEEMSMEESQEYELLKEFNMKCDEMEASLAEGGEAAEEIYSELRELYMVILESGINGDDKNKLYQIVADYYSRLKQK